MINSNTQEPLQAPLWGNRQADALMISCSPLQSKVQSKLDELFQSSSQETVADLATDKPRRTESKKSNQKRRHLSSSSVNGRSKRLEEDTIQMRLSQSSELMTQLKIFGILPLALIVAAIAFLYLTVM